MDEIHSRESLVLVSALQFQTFVGTKALLDAQIWLTARDHVELAENAVGVKHRLLAFCRFQERTGVHVRDFQTIVVGVVARIILRLDNGDDQRHSQQRAQSEWLHGDVVWRE